MKHLINFKLILMVSLGLFFSHSWGQVTTFSYTGATDTYTVPAGVTSIQIESKGSKGENGTSGGVGGNGAIMIGTFTVTPGEILTVYAGGNPVGLQSGGDGSYASDGGGTLMIAAGGGGAGGWNQYGGAALITNSGAAPPVHSGGAGGVGGSGGIAGTGAWGTGGGGGWLTAGTNGSGSVGGASPCRASLGTTYAGGAGGGYSGGGGVEMYGGAGTGGGGAGGSFNGGIDQTNTAGANAGLGQVIITVLCDGLTTIVSATTVCEGDLVTLDATSTNGGAITWDGGVTNGVAFAPPVGVTTYSATSDHIDDCGFQVDILVHALPTVTASVDDDEVCDGESFTFTGGGADTYTWDLGVTDGVAFTAAVGTATYTVTGIDGNGCQNTASVDATVYNLPTVTASVDDDEVCDGESFTFTGGGAATYIWDLGVTDGVAFTAAVGTATYTVTGTDGNGCQNTASVDATVYNLPTVTASVDDDEVCDGESFTFTGGGAATYTWDLGVTDGVAFTAAVGTATYTVIGIDGNGCENTASVDATVYNLPTVTASVDDDEVCDGESFTFTG
ncbi:MAG: hypothetical protein ACI8ZM_003845, partial [Crocinitomix sp.]